MDNERRAWLFLNQIPEIGPMRFHRLLHAARSAEGVLRMSVPSLQAAGVSLEIAESWRRAFCDPASWKCLDSEMERMEKRNFGVITEMDEAYPARLRELLDRPPVLYYKGKWPDPAVPIVGMVGTRDASSYGLAAAERLAIDLAMQGVATVSGLARGIDACVHRTALRSQGFTVAVLGCGLGHVFPKENSQLQNDIAEAGLLVTEFPYESVPDARHFPRRNRIISGLSQGVVVIEARAKSGALITARYAAEQGRDVFAVPGNILEGRFAGCHQLLRDGARLIESAADIMEELQIPGRVEAPAARQTCGEARLPAAASSAPAPLSPMEARIVELLNGQALSVDELVEAGGTSFDVAADMLLSLELKNVIRHLPGQRYEKNYRS